MRSKEQIREFFAILAMPVMLLAVEIGSVLLAMPMNASGYAVFEDPHMRSLKTQSHFQIRYGLS